MQENITRVSIRLNLDNENDTRVYEQLKNEASITNYIKSLVLKDIDGKNAIARLASMESKIDDILFRVAHPNLNTEMDSPKDKSDVFSEIEHQPEANEASQPDNEEQPNDKSNLNSDDSFTENFFNSWGLSND